MFATGLKVFLAAWAVMLALALGCALTDYPVITDDRGDYSGIIRTGHKAWVEFASGQAATVYADGSDELYHMVYQNQYGDQSLYTFNNFDPTGAVNFLDQTYCDWKFEECEIVRAWNPVQNDVDEYDYEFFPDCSGARSLSFLSYQRTRFGECGDALFGGADVQERLRVFSELGRTTWRGETAYHVPINARTASVSVTSATGRTALLPLFGQHDVIMTHDLDMVVPMTPAARHQMRWLQAWAAENGPVATVNADYEGLEMRFDVKIRQEGLAYNAQRF